MKIKCCFFSLLLAVILVSCKDGKKDVVVKDVVLDDIETSGEINNERAAIHLDSIIRKLQGKWKESEYPYRVAHFENNTVKFIEEGVAEETVFQEYSISKECPFQVNNLKNANDGDLFLVMTDSRTCEILNVNDSILTLGGYNVSSNSDYNIVYKKAE